MNLFTSYVSQIATCNLIALGCVDMLPVISLVASNAHTHNKHPTLKVESLKMDDKWMLIILCLVTDLIANKTCVGFPVLRILIEASFSYRASKQ